MSKHETQKSKKRWVQILKVSSLTFLVLTISAILFTVSYLLGIEEWQEFDPHQIKEDMELSLLLYDGQGEEYLMLSAGENRLYATIDTIPKHVQNAFVAIEDARFYQHNGIDIVRILGALVEDIKSGSIKQGASTISQQLVKTAALTFDQNITRKLTEIMMAFKLEEAYTKDEILELYLNIVYFGKGAHGIEMAAKEYFGKSASELTLSEGALLAGILKSPSNYAPHINMEKSLARRDLVLEQMLENEFITQEEYLDAIAEKIVLAPEEEEEYPYGFYTDRALYEATTLLNTNYTELMSQGYRIYTTLDPSMQTYLETLAEDPANFPENAQDGSPVECASIVLDANTGAIQALLGGREHTTRLAFNRATSMRRQPGSAIKPVIVFAPALEYADYSTVSFLLDQPENFGGYAPRNSGSTYRGWVTLRDTVAYSINIPAVKLLNEITVAKGKSYASSVGIPFEEKDKNLSLALGGFTTGVTPLELCGSYLPFANGGYYQQPTCIEKIVDRYGNVVYERPSTRYSVLSEESAFLMSSMLESSVEYGTSKNVKVENVPLAAKTGTSSYDDAKNNKDAWIVAYNPQYVVCCWMGFDKTDEQHSLPQGVTGGTFPATFTSKFFSHLYEKKQAPSFSIPSTIYASQIDGAVLENLYEVRLASSATDPENIVTEYFTEENRPVLIAEYATPKAPIDFLVTTGEDGYPKITFTSQMNTIYYLSREEAGGRSAKQLFTFTGTGEVLEYVDYDAQLGKEYIYHLTPGLPASSLKPADYENPQSSTYLYFPQGGTPEEQGQPGRQHRKNQRP